MIGGEQPPEVRPESNDQVDAAGRHGRLPQPSERIRRLRQAHATAQVELEEVVGNRALGKDAVLRYQA